MAQEFAVELATCETGSEIPASEHVADARLTLHRGGLVFLNGKKMKALRTVDRASFENLDCCLAWTGGPSHRIRFGDLASLQIFQTAVQNAQARSSAIQTPQRAAGLIRPVESPAASTPPPQTSRKRATCSKSTPAKRLADAKKQATSAGDDCDAKEIPVDAPRVDANLSEEDRVTRRSVLAQCAEERATAEKARGIGDIAAVQRLQDRAAREELIGRITERFALQKRDVPWNLGRCTMEELRTYLS